MATMKDYRLRARLTLSQLSRIARIDLRTVKRAEEGHAIREVQATAIAEALSEALNTRLTPEELGIRIFQS